MSFVARSVVAFTSLFAFAAAPSVASAQAPSPATTQTQEAAPASSESAPEGDAHQAAKDQAAKDSADKASGSSGTSAGYSYSDKPKPKKAAGNAKHVSRATHADGAVATLPGFEEHEDGSTRLFVRLTKNVPVEEQQGKGTLTFVLKGAHVRTRNNTRALETVHFNTPVVRARLVPKKGDLLFVVDLRADVAPTWKIQDEQDKTAILTIDFPKGTFLAKTADADDAR